LWDGLPTPTDIAPIAKLNLPLAWIIPAMYAMSQDYLRLKTSGADSSNQTQNTTDEKEVWNPHQGKSQGSIYGYKEEDWQDNC
jgi:hypothetical protein